MSRTCPKCGYKNSDDFNFCAKCGTLLVENPSIPPRIGVQPLSKSMKRKLIISSYIITIFLSWSGVLIAVLGLKNSFGIIGFFGIFMPFYLVQAPDPEIRKHGYIMLVLSVIGMFLSFYLFFYY